MHRQGGFVHFASRAAHSQIKQEEHGRVKRIVARTGRLLAIYSLREVYLIKQLIIQIKADIILLPVHAPHVELRGPLSPPQQALAWIWA